ncbi:hypothetical protein [Lysinibacillus sp. NPDC056232]|uniref:hypothetical protein n=1 Tax=Lysinibacillus sp. NPDC056232 TaxID=3345756 RepID=UPI0035DFB81F
MRLKSAKRSVSNWILSVKAKRQQQQHEVGHPGVFTGCEGFSLSSSFSAGFGTPMKSSLNPQL